MSRPERLPWAERPRWQRWTGYAVAGVALLLVAVAVLSVATVRHSFPQTSGTIEVPGLDGEVTVVRDGHGVPEVYADTAQDLFFAQGFVQAQDRFFQMDVRRHAAAGRLSEMFGEDTLESDKVARTLGWRRVAQVEVRRLDEQASAYLEAFSAGVNAYVSDRSSAELSLEYTLLSLGGLDHTVEPWSAADSLAWLKVVAWEQRGDLQDEIDRAMASTRLDADQVADLYPPSVPTTAGSAWVVDGEHTTTGKPLLANNPALAPTLPGAWYQMGLHCTTVGEECPFDVSGFTYAGVPGVVVGHNQRVAWGMTDAGADVADLYLEAVDGERYRRGSRWREFERREETIEVAGEEPFRFTVRSSLHGPLLSDVAGRLASVGANAPVDDAAPDRGEGYAVAVAWTALTPGRTAEALFAMNRATGWRELRAAARDWAAPLQSIVYADGDGNIGYQLAGRLPVRGERNRGDWPAPGWDRRADWSGEYVGFAELPSVLNPEEGFVVAGDSGSPVDDGGAGRRVLELLTERLAGRGRVGPGELAAIQLDTRNGVAAALVPHLLRVDAGSGYYSGGKHLLRRWDFDQPADSPAAAYFNAVWKSLLKLTFADELPDSVEVDGSPRWFEVVTRLLDRPDSPWWDDVDTEDVREGRDDILRRAMRDARDELVRLQSRRPGRWTWGHQHTLTLENPMAAHTGGGPTARLLDRGPWRLGGGEGAVDATGWVAAAGFEVTTAPSMRMVVSLADLDASRWVNLTGASGHAFNEHYTDQTDRWAEGGSLPWPFTRVAVDAATEDTLVLVPPRTR